jgi:hypothetical protein
MDANWFNDLFDDEYDNAMNNIVQYVSNGLVVQVLDVVLDVVAVLVMGTIQMTTTTTTTTQINTMMMRKMICFWLRECDCNKLLLCTAGALTLYYNNYIYKKPCMVSYNTGMRWLNEILNGHWVRCVNMFWMNADTLQSLCVDLETLYGLK